MPKTDYKCQQCGEKFEYSKGLFERENKIKCPKCGSQNLKKAASVVHQDQFTNPFETRGGI